MNAAINRHERADGAARIEFRASGDGRTRLADLYQRAPCRVLFPGSEADEPVQAVLLTTSGGLTGGDRTRVEVEIGARAQATVTTQAAEKLYRALDGDDDTRIHVEVKVGSDAWAEWLAQETILFNGARLRRSFSADVAAEGRLLAVESIVFGRTAMGEHFDAGLLHDSWQIRREGRLVWADVLRLEGDIRNSRRAPFAFGTAVACSTVVYVGRDAVRQLDEVRKLLGLRAPSGPPSPRAPKTVAATEMAATAFDGLLLVRLLSDDAAELRSEVMNVVAGLRRCAGGLSAQMPRVWHC